MSGRPFISLVFVSFNPVFLLHAKFVNDVLCCIFHLFAISNIVHSLVFVVLFNIFTNTISVFMKFSGYCSHGPCGLFSIVFPSQTWTSKRNWAHRLRLVTIGLDLALFLAVWKYPTWSILQDCLVF